MDPWTDEYQRAAFELYRSHFSDVYLNWLANVFASAVPATASLRGDSAATVATYLRTASEVILEAGPTPGDAPEKYELRNRTPAVMPFTRIAGLVSNAGARALVDAGRAVHHRAGHQTAPPISEEELSWVQRLAQGLRVVDLAEEVNYCERSMYRHLSLVWDRLSVRNRQEAIALAVREGWI